MQEQAIRNEWKHVISHVQYYKIRNELEVFLFSDIHQSGIGYTVRTLYYDTPGKRDLRANLDGIRNKCKLRLRTYPDDAPVYKLELKCKNGFESKKRFLLLTPEEARRISLSDDSFLLDKRNPLATEIYQRIHRECYRPQLVVEYQREAFEHTINRTRITFDTQVRVSHIKGDFFSTHPVGTPILAPQQGILEVKFDREFPPHLKGILAKVGIRPQAFSKYVQGQLSRAR